MRAHDLLVLTPDRRMSFSGLCFKSFNFSAGLVPARLDFETCARSQLGIAAHSGTSFPMAPDSTVKCLQRGAPAIRGEDPTVYVSPSGVRLHLPT
jgi:hypothetical protein